jgi:hypothetical protein
VIKQDKSSLAMPRRSLNTPSRRRFLQLSCGGAAGAALILRPSSSTAQIPQLIALVKVVLRVFEVALASREFWVALRGLRDAVANSRFIVPIVRSTKEELIAALQSAGISAADTYIQNVQPSDILIRIDDVTDGNVTVISKQDFSFVVLSRLLYLEPSNTEAWSFQNIMHSPKLVDDYKNLGHIEGVGKGQEYPLEGVNLRTEGQPTGTYQIAIEAHDKDNRIGGTEQPSRVHLLQDGMIHQLAEAGLVHVYA